MTNRVRLLLILAVAFLAGFARAGTVDISYRFSDHTGSPLAVKRLVLTPLVPLGLFNASNITFNVPVPRQTDASGGCTVSNLSSGYAYRVELFDAAFVRLGVFTNSIGTNISGQIAGRDFLGASTNLTGGIYAYSMAASDARFAPISVTNYTGGGGTTYTNNSAGVAGKITGSGISTNVSALVGTNVWTQTNAVLQAGINGKVDKANGVAVGFTAQNSADLRPNILITNTEGLSWGVVLDFQGDGWLHFTNFTTGDDVVITDGAHVRAGLFIGDGSQLTNIQAASIVGGFDGLTVTNAITMGASDLRIKDANDNIVAEFSAVLLDLDSYDTSLTAYNGTFRNHVTASYVTVTGDITASTFTGDGSHLTGINSAFGSVDASNIVSGTIAAARYGFTPATNGANILPSQIASNGTYIVNGVLATNSGVTTGAFLTETGSSRKYSNNGSGITNVVAAYVSGTLTNSTTGNAATATLASFVSGTLSNSITGNAATATTLATSPTVTNLSVWGSAARSNGFAFDSSGLTMTNLVGITNTMFNSSTGLVFTASGTNGSGSFKISTNGGIYTTGTLTAGASALGAITTSGSLLQSSGNLIPAVGVVLNYFNQDTTLTRYAAGTCLITTNARAPGIITAVNGFGVEATNTVALAATGWTNTLGANARVFITASTTAALSSTNGTAIVTIGAVATFTQFDMHPNERLVGTGITGTATP